MFRETILIGDSKSGTSRALRRQIFFTEPGSGRFTLRESTGHAGGRGRHGTVQPLISEEMFKKGKGTANKSSGMDEARWRPTTAPTRVGGGIGKGSNSEVKSHLNFTRSLRPDARSETSFENIPISNEEWRAASGFPVALTMQAPLRRAWTPTARFDSEEDRRRVGFKDRGRRRFGTIVHSQEQLRATAALANPPWEDGRAAGGPSGPKALVSWRDWKISHGLNKQNHGGGIRVARQDTVRGESNVPSSRGSSRAATSRTEAEQPKPRTCQSGEDECQVANKSTHEAQSTKPPFLSTHRNANLPAETRASRLERRQKERRGATGL